MNVNDAIDLVKEKDKRKIRCQCPDCEAQTLLVAEIERLRAVEVEAHTAMEKTGLPPPEFTPARVIEILDKEESKLANKELKARMSTLERGGIQLILEFIPERMKKSPSVQAAIAYLASRVY